jgi:hypothetical protein
MGSAVTSDVPVECSGDPMPHIYTLTAEVGDRGYRYAGEQLFANGAIAEPPQLPPWE